MSKIDLPNNQDTPNRVFTGWYQWLAILITLSMTVAAVVCVLERSFVLAGLALITATTAGHTLLQILKIELGR